MEANIKKRAPIRASFTKLYKSIKTLFEDENSKVDDILIKYDPLERTYNNLLVMDEAILEMLLGKETELLKYDDEYENVEEYRQKFEEIRRRLQLLNDKLLKNAPNVEYSEKTKLKLPKIELMRFGGEIKDWLTFWCQFKRINDDKHMELEDKFQYLMQCMISGTMAKEIIDSYLPTAENYHKAIESLQKRFGREELLIEYYVRELLGLVIKNATNIKSKLSIIQLYDKLESHLRALESIGMTSDKYAAMLFPLVESCILEDISRIWLRNPSLNEEDKSYSKILNNLLSFLRAEVEGEERIYLAKTGIKQNEYILKSQRPIEQESTQPTASDLFFSNKNDHKILCVFCEKSSHLSKDCFHGQKMNSEEKMNILKSKRCCYSCLKIGHTSKKCRNKPHCICCGRKHYIIMCPDFKPTKNKQDRAGEAESSSLSNVCQTKEVLLQTLLVAIENDGKRHVVRALIDTGSQSSYILESSVKKLRLRPTHSQGLTHVVFGGATSYKQYNCYVVEVHNLNTSYFCKITVLDQPQICGPIPRIKDQLDLKELKQKGIKITDFSQEIRPIEMLIGADMAGKIYTGKVIPLKSGLTAMETYLGWVVMEMQTSDHSRKSIDAVSSSLLSQSFNIENVWNLEALGIQDPYESKDKIELENAVRENIIKTMTVEDGRYEVKLPWKCKDYLHDNRILAEKRLEKTIDKLIAQNKYEAYNAVLEERLQEDFIEVVPPEELSQPSCYLPHRGVFKEGNVTTKVRTVFDASSKLKGHRSLNESLEKGPNTLEIIPSILMKFREDKIGVVSDIKKAFLQISVSPEERNFLRFLWWRNSDDVVEHSKKDIQVYRHKRVVFGLTCSPFILGAVVQHHLDKSAPEIQHIAQKLKKCFYVDNCVTSVNSKEEYEEFVETSKKLMTKARIELRGWESSSLEKPDKECEPTPVLGLLWDKEEDTLFCNVKNISGPTGILTRRTLLSVTQKVFDPIGFTSPVTLYPKVLLQESWKEKLSWDTSLPKEVCDKLLKRFQELNLLKHLKIPRRIIYVFCDASGFSYAAVVFVRNVRHDEICVQMALTKSRVAPLKKMTIPRFELMACTIGVRLLDFVKKTLELKDVPEYFWTDSATALYSICHEEPWGVFVQNRVKEIRKLSNTENWQHIQATQNPADLPSRGCSVEKLINSRWWEGPEWLSKEEREWPKSSVQSTGEANQEKLKVALVVNSPLDREWYVQYFSSYKKILRMVAWMRRFISNCKRSQQERLKGELSGEEINAAEKNLMKIVQQEQFSDEYFRSLKTVTSFEDKEGLIRVKTKLTERKDFENFKTPILLPGKHKLVELMIHESQSIALWSEQSPRRRERKVLGSKCKENCT